MGEKDVIWIKLILEDRQFVEWYTIYRFLGKKNKPTC